MHLESSIVIRRQPEQVWSFLANVANIPKWDRGVAGIQRTTFEPMGVGSEFDTVADPAARDDAQSQGRMSYRIADVDPDQHRCTVQLTSRDGNARYFQDRSVDVPRGSGSGRDAADVFRRFHSTAPVLDLGARLLCHEGSNPRGPQTAQAGN
jgi:hypothetical protein